jgi:hypothetical protein
MSRYDPLSKYLSSRSESEWHAGFSDVEKVLGFPLPNSARRYSAWWANQQGAGHSQVRGWRDVGWRTAAVDLARESVRFERVERQQRGGSERAALLALGRNLDRPEVLEANTTTDLRAKLERAAIEWLVAAGGSMPEFEPAPRRRPLA